MKHAQQARDAKPQTTGFLQAAGSKVRAGKLDEAERLYRALIASRPLHFDALRGLGLLLLRQRRSEEALETLGMATRAAPTHAGAWCEFGVAHAFLGRLPDALGCYDRALSLDPRCAGALANKGDALAALKRPLEALACYDKALALSPRLVTVLSNRGGLLRELGRPAEALASLDRALAFAPGDADALSNRGNALVALGRCEEALASYDKALAAHPNDANAHNNRGNALMGLGRTHEALASYDGALALGPASVETLINRGAALRALGRSAEAVDCFAKATALAPHFAPSHKNLANALVALERPLEALACYERAIALDPDYVEALADRANALVALKRPLEAIASCDKALALAPGHVEALNNRGAALAALGREREALANYDAALAGRPDFALAHDNKGVALLQLGRLEEARAAFKTAIACAPSRASAYHHLALSGRFEAGDSHVAALEALAREDAATKPQDRVYAHFALGKALADIADYEGSFRHFAAGNAWKRQLMPYHEAAALGRLERTRLAYSDEMIERLRGGGPMSAAPVFVVGMPRSGTTLVEQILASHPGVHGAGEINDLDVVAYGIGGEAAEAMSEPEAAWRMRPEDFHRIGAAYLSRLEGYAPLARRVVNKTTENFRHAGLIALALPNARVVHAQRRPIDTCFSCFVNLFPDGVPYANNIGELARYYRGYETLMAHWRRVLPPGMMIEVHYEDIIADLEGEGRRLVAHCGLDWDPRCLDFHRNERSVRTASLAQVRRPIYGDSVGRWRRYEAFLGPLIEALGCADSNETATA